MMTLLLAGRLTPTNVALLAAAREVGLDAVLLPAELAAARARPGDVVLPRLDVLPGLDGIEPGLSLLDGLARRGVRVVNGAGTVVAAHDKLATAVRLGAAGVPHPRTAHVGPGAPGGVTLPFPVVVKPRLGSWGRDVSRCADEQALESCLARFSDRPWFHRQGALVQELVPPQGHDLRILVAAGVVVGAVRRIAARGEWRTNVALGGTREPVVPPAPARRLAVAAAEAVGGGFIGVDLLPDGDGGWVVLELNGCVDFTHEYGLLGSDPFVEVVCALDRLGEREAVLA